MQTDLFSTTTGRPQTISLGGFGDLSYRPAWLDTQQADRYFAQLAAEVVWEQPQVTVYGQRHRIPRLQAWYGDPGAVMTYSGTRFQPRAWHPALAQLRQCLQAECGGAFNSVLVNLYRDGDDGVGWHADDEPELGRRPLIASVSLGAERTFSLKPKGKNGPNAGLAGIQIPLKHGDLLVMGGETQHYWQHALAKTKRVRSPRINLTFRHIRT